MCGSFGACFRCAGFDHSASYYTWIVNICTVLLINSFPTKTNQLRFASIDKDGEKNEHQKDEKVHLCSFNVQRLQTCWIPWFDSNAKSVAPKTVGLVRRIDESDAAVVDFEGTGEGRTIYLNKGLSQQSLNPTRQLTFVKEKLWMKPGEQMGV